MKTLRLNWLWTLTFALVAFSCNNDDNGNTGGETARNDLNIVEVVSANEDLSLLEEAVIKANLAGALQTDGPFTLFAPNDAAFIALLELLGDNYNSLDDFDTALELQILGAILSYHVVPAELSSGLLTPGPLPTLLPENTIEIIAEGDGFVIGDASPINANIIGADNEASNGVVHIIDKILLPEAASVLFNDPGDGDPEKSIKDLVVESEDLTFLEEALIKTDLLDTLDTDGPFTVFAPSDTALNQLLALLGLGFTGLDSFDSEFRIGLLRDILLYHVVPGQVMAGDLAAGEVPTLLADNFIEVVPSGNGFVLQDVTGFDATILATDIEANNGVVHIINRILIPKETLTSLAPLLDEQTLAALLANPDLAILYNAVILGNEDIKTALEQTSPFTFFAPTNQAFLDLFDVLGVADIRELNTPEGRSLLASILSYHAIQGEKFTATQFTDGQMLTTVQGESLLINVTNGVVSIQDASPIPASFVMVDAEVGNGVIHSIDKVLLSQEVLTALANQNQ